MGAKAVGYSGVGARTAATDAFSGGTTGGEAGTPAAGAGLGGAGISSGPSLKANDPNLDSNDSSIPACNGQTPENVSPWQKWLDIAMYATLAAGVLIIAANLLAKTVWGRAAAVYVAYAAMAAAAVVILAGIVLMAKYGQKWMGGLYTVVGCFLMYQAYMAMVGASEAAAAGSAGSGSIPWAGGDGPGAAANIC